MARAVGDFSPTNPPESELFSFDFTEQLRPGDSVKSTVAAEWTCIVAVAGLTGDPSPQDRLVDSPTIFGNITTQRMAGWVAGVTYAVSAEVETVLGDTLLLWAYCPDETVGC